MVYILNYNKKFLRNNIFKLLIHACFSWCSVNKFLFFKPVAATNKWSYLMVYTTIYCININWNAISFEILTQNLHYYEKLQYQRSYKIKKQHFVCNYQWKFNIDLVFYHYFFHLQTSFFQKVTTTLMIPMERFRIYWPR